MRRSMVALALVPFLLSACGGGQAEPAKTPDRAPTTSMTYYPSPAATSTRSAAASAPSAAPSPVSTTAGLPEPVMPAAAKANTPDGAAAFARYWFEAFNYSWQAPNPSVLDKLSDPGCRTCASYTESARTLAANHQRADKAPFKLATADPGPFVDGEQMVIVTGRQVPYRRVGAATDKTATPEVRLSAQLFLKWTPAGWTVTEVERIK